MRFPFLRGAVRHMKLIGGDPQFQALRARNEARLAALKKANRLYEVKSESTPTGNSARAVGPVPWLFQQQLNEYYNQHNTIASASARDFSPYPYGLGSIGNIFSELTRWNQ